MWNALTVDVEDWFHVTRLRDRIPPQDWKDQQSRVVENVARILVLLDEFRVKATFFILGWVAERHPELVKAIADQGHEIGSHGYRHQLIYEQSRAEFARDVRRSVQILEEITDKPILSYRAPTYSINAKTLWAFEILCENGIQIDSSLFPVKHDLYGELSCPHHFFKIPVRGKGFITECPIATLELWGRKFPIGGGGHLRCYPLRLIEQGIERLNRKRQAAVIYFHPWEIDPLIPRVETSLLRGMVQYTGIRRTEDKIRQLLQRFDFTTLQETVQNIKLEEYWPRWPAAGE